MALKVFLIAITLFLAEVIFITSKDFNNVNFTKQALDFTDISFENIDGYLITEKGIESTIKATKVLKYSDKTKAFDVKTNFMTQKRQYKISAKTALLKEDIIELKGDVHYENNESLKVDSQYLIYNTKSELIISKTPFIMNSPQGTVKGTQFEYDQKNGNIRANNLNYLSRKEL